MEWVTHSLNRKLLWISRFKVLQTSYMAWCSSYTLDYKFKFFGLKYIRRQIQFSTMIVWSLKKLEGLITPVNNIPRIVALYEHDSSSLHPMQQPYTYISADSPKNCYKKILNSKQSQKWLNVLCPIERSVRITTSLLTPPMQCVLIFKNVWWSLKFLMATLKDRFLRNIS